MRCVSICFSDFLDLYLLEKRARHLGYVVERFQNVLQVKDPQAQSLCHYFKNGTLVSWCPGKNAENDFIDLALSYANQTLVVPTKDSFSVRFKESTSIQPHDYFNIEVLSLETDEDELKLACAFGFSQSIKLKHYEHVIESLVSKYTPAITQLAQSGTASLPRKKIQSIIAEILQAKSQINLVSDFFNPPKFFWNYPGLEEDYQLVEAYLDIRHRIGSLNHKLNTLGETFEMFNGYLETKHSHFLEIIIIVLIATEIIFNLIDLHF